ncbi:MAG TPA: hypothetical protein VFE47_26130 [Tepidisphaeraceae bacterium]|jgi:hypothetical protein|nr:hypothetical protein [Tepidisphaeraceae bacterium]
MEEQPINDWPDADAQSQSRPTYTYDAYLERPALAPNAVLASGQVWETWWELAGCEQDGNAGATKQTVHRPSITVAGPDCAGTGVVTLLTTQQPCAHCSGSGKAPA